jgi:hypothetical protein
VGPADASSTTGTKATGTQATGTPATGGLALADEVVVLRATVARLQAEAAGGVAELERSQAARKLAQVDRELSRVRALLAECRESAPGRRPSTDTVRSAAAFEALVLERDAEIAAIRRSATWRVGRLVIAPAARLRRLVPGARR